MTGGVAVILGPVGENFGAGMTGGMAFVFDPQNRFPALVNPETVTWHRIETRYWDDVLLGFVREHIEETQSRFAEELLNDWERTRGHFWHVVPQEMLSRLPHPLVEPLAAAGE